LRVSLVARPKRITRADGAVVGCLPELDVVRQPCREQLAIAIRDVAKGI
jgi:pyruvate dehydrogenase E1 component beta subunit